MNMDMRLIRAEANRKQCQSQLADFLTPLLRESSQIDSAGDITTSRIQRIVITTISGLGVIEHCDDMSDRGCLEELMAKFSITAECEHITPDWCLTLVGSVLFLSSREMLHAEAIAKATDGIFASCSKNVREFISSGGVRC